MPFHLISRAASFACAATDPTRANFVLHCLSGLNTHRVRLLAAAPKSIPCTNRSLAICYLNASARTETTPIWTVHLSDLASKLLPALLTRSRSCFGHGGASLPSQAGFTAQKPNLRRGPREWPGLLPAVQKERPALASTLAILHYVVTLRQPVFAGFRKIFSGPSSRASAIFSAISVVGTIPPERMRLIVCQ